ncbi:unnamed protein product [Parnassius mnemosyne]|uniref:SWIM-type domain-containing protein n=1 Tax=Parnassius mnemosyne TaxID=213953 RepID=A0AAV1L7W3_9NEOP
MSYCVLSKVPAIAENVLNEVEERINAADVKQFSDEDLLTLHSVFGVVLQRALDIIEKYSTFVTYCTKGKSRELIEINGENDRCYRVFPRINFCPCRAFKHQVLEKKTQVTCKHVLAARIQQILGKTVNHDISHNQYLMLVKSMFDLEEKNDG